MRAEPTQTTSNAVTAAANALVSQRFLLPQDVATYVTPATLMVIPASP